jgi:hypothetical protein
MLRPTIWIPVAALIGAAGCSSGSDKQAMDDELKRDLSAAVRAPAQVVVSPLEAGVAPAPKAPQRAKAPAPRPAKQVATAPAPAPAPKPAPAPAAVATEVAAESAEPVAQPVEAPAAPAMHRPGSRPAQTEERRGPYKTEAEIFRQFPMIRP